MLASRQLVRQEAYVRCNARSTEHGAPEEQTKNMASDPAASLPVPLSLYCFICKDCKKQPHQRGALLEVQDAHKNPI